MIDDPVAPSPTRVRIWHQCFWHEVEVVSAQHETVCVIDPSNSDALLDIHRCDICPADLCRVPIPMCRILVDDDWVKMPVVAVRDWHIVVCYDGAECEMNRHVVHPDDDYAMPPPAM